MELFRHTKARIRGHYYYLRERLSPSKIADARQIPIIINNYNRLSMLRQLIDSLTKRGYTRIVILDNKSTYPPLLEWYETCPYEVVHLPKNYGFKALWKHAPPRRRFCGDYYIYTDPDVRLADECPDDIIERMLHILKDCRPKAFKIGPSIRISDLPSWYAHRHEVVAYESRYFGHTDEADGLLLYRAPIDTTLALYRPRVGLSRSAALEAYRMGEPYSIQHLPWYLDSEHLDEEERYYLGKCQKATTWSAKK